MDCQAGVVSVAVALASLFTVPSECIVSAPADLKRFPFS
jgi:hypothetical protein